MLPDVGTLFPHTSQVPSFSPVFWKYNQIALRFVLVVHLVVEDKGWTRVLDCEELLPLMLLVEVVGGEEGSVFDDETSLIIDAISVPRRSKTATGSEDSRVSAATGSEDSKVSG